VRAVIEVAEECAIELEDRDLEAIEADDLAAGILELRRRTNVHLGHFALHPFCLTLRSPPKAGVSKGELFGISGLILRDAPHASRPWPTCASIMIDLG